MFSVVTKLTNRSKKNCPNRRPRSTQCKKKNQPKKDEQVKEIEQIKEDKEEEHVKKDESINMKSNPKQKQVWQKKVP